MMTEKLKPCAYCQSPLELEYMDYNPYAVGGRWFVNCTNMDCPTYFNDEDKYEVIRAWNTRYHLSCKDCVAECPVIWADEHGNCKKIDSYVDYCSHFARKE
jgi:hypothetical protein